MKPFNFKWIKNKDKYKERFIYERNLLNKGIGESNTIRGFIEVAIAAFVLMEYFNLQLSKWWILPIGLGVLFMYRTIGWAWEKTHLWDVEANYSNKRNPLMRRLNRKL